MVTLVKRIVRGIVYYYLEHAFRENGKVSKRSRYLGRRVPKDLEEIKRQLVYEADKEKWFDKFDLIRKNYAAERARTPETARQGLLKEFSVRFTYDTQRIEGSTLNLRETARLLGEGISPSGKPLQDAKEAEAHQKVFFTMLSYKKDLTLGEVLHWHKTLFAGTKPDIAGLIRKHGVKIAGSKFTPPSPVELQPLLRQFFSWYESRRVKIHPVELAALTHLKWVSIHPFSDGNGRISRLMMNFVLYRHGFPMLNIDYATRQSYYNALEKSQVKNQERIFCQWLFRKYLKENKPYLD